MRAMSSCRFIVSMLRVELMLLTILGLGCSMQLDHNTNFKVVPKQEVYLAGEHNNFQKCSMYYSLLQCSHVVVM
jgi:hypothetical protein